MEFRIDRLGARGDGVAETDDGPVYIPFALPGETVDAQNLTRRGDGRAAALKRLVKPSPDRADPACRHFAECGGCALQHVAASAYGDWKRALVENALRHQGIEADILPPVSVEPGTRRRVRLAFRKAGKVFKVGFREARSDRIVDIAECAVASPALNALVPHLRRFLDGRVDRGDAAVAETAQGADVTVFARTEPDLALRLDAPEFCGSADIARLSWVTGKTPPDPVIVLQTPSVLFGKIEVSIPPDSFLQPTAAGEATLRTIVLEGLADRSIVADLFAGCGAFALPLAASGKTVHAVDSVASQITALRSAASGLNLTAETRDLDRQPLRAADLERFDAVVLDPPRAGAAPQVAQLAASAVATIAYVSCNPATFARDARVLIDGGYVMGPVQPVDQFLWSHHVELASVFKKR